MLVCCLPTTTQIPLTGLYDVGAIAKNVNITACIVSIATNNTDNVQKPALSVPTLLKPVHRFLVVTLQTAALALFLFDAGLGCSLSNFQWTLITSKHSEKKVAMSLMF